MIKLYSKINCSLAPVLNVKPLPSPSSPTPSMDELGIAWKMGRSKTFFIYPAVTPQCGICIGQLQVAYHQVAFAQIFI